MKNQLDFDPQSAFGINTKALALQDFYRQKIKSLQKEESKNNNLLIKDIRKKFPSVMTEFFNRVPEMEAVTIHFTCGDENIAIRGIDFITESMKLNAHKHGFKIDFSGTITSRLPGLEFSINDEFYTKIKFNKEFDAKKRSIIRELDKFILRNEEFLVKAFAEPHLGIMFTKTGKIFKEESC